MPYPNEHACRLKQPKDDADYRREKGAATISGKKVDHIYMVDGEDSDLQSVRFPKDNGWGTDAATTQARDWCKGKGGTFEAMSSSDSRRAALTVAAGGEGRPYNHVRIVAFRTDEETGINFEERTIPGWASTPEVDSYDEIIKPSAYESSLEAYLRNPVMYWNHQWNTVPIGATMEAEIYSKKGLWTRSRIGTTELAQEVWTAIAVDRTVRSMSVGFYAEYSPEWGYWDKDQERWIWTDLELMEISVVGMPACASAQFELSRSMGLPMMRSVGVQALPLASVEHETTPDEALARLRDASANIDRYCLWKQQYPLADNIDGEVCLVWSSVATAMATLLGARGGIDDMPYPAQRAAFEVLSRCYHRFEKDVPTWNGPWPQGLRDVTFHADEQEMLEGTIAKHNARIVLAGAQSLANVGRHWGQSGGGRSAKTLSSAAARSIAQLTDFLTARSDHLSDADRSALRGSVGKLQGMVPPESGVIRITTGGK